MKKRILSILLLCCMVLTLLPTAAFAAGELPDVKLSVPTTFDKTVDLTGQNKELKITDSKTYLIKGSADPNWYFQYRIKIDGKGKNITPHIFLDGVRLQAPKDGPAIELYGGASACLYFIGGDSELIGAENFAALQKNKTDGYLRVLVQTGTKLTCEGGRYGAGIGGSKVGIKNFSQGHGMNLHFGSLATGIYGGEILATSGVYGAGIGGGQGGVGEWIYVYSGKLTVRSVSEGAGIGGGQGGPGRFIYIKGGTVNAGSESGGAGIGSGDQDGQNKSEDAHHIEISGGTVEAWSNYAGAGIGGGRNGSGRDISITGGVVRAQGYLGAGIGGGMNGDSGNILIKDTTLTALAFPLYQDYGYTELSASAVGRGSNRAYYMAVMQDQEFAMIIEENIKIGASDGKSVWLSATGWQWRHNQEPYKKYWGTTTELLIPNENGRVDLQRLSLPYAYNYGRVISKLELRCEESTCSHELGWTDRDGCHIWACVKCGARDPAAEMSKQNAKHIPGDWSNQKQLCTVCGYVMGTDTKAPVLEGLKNGESYTIEDDIDGNPGAYTFTVSDPAASGETSSGIKSVTINGEPQTGPTYRLPAPDGGNNDAGAEHTVVATDNAGNTTMATVKIYRRHHVKVISPDGNGTASASPDKAVAGTEITLTATPKEGYRFKEWQVVSPAELVITNNKFTMPDSNVEVKAIFKDMSKEQFDLAPGGRYYFDLSAMDIPGTVNGDLPDSTLHYVPFTYAGTVDAYKLMLEMAATDEYAEKNKYAHSLFVADYTVTHTVSWDELNAGRLIFGRDYAAGGVDYILRAPSVGSGSIGSAESQRGTPPSNEWDRILDKNDGYIKNWFGMFSWGQDTLSTSESDRAARGYFPPGRWSSAPASHQDAVAGFRPVLEILSPGSLGSDGLKAVTLDLGGGKLGNSSEDIQIIVKSGESFAAPASDGLTRPDGNTDNYFKWLGSDGEFYEPGDNVSADVTKLTAQFNLPEQFTLAPGGTYYFDLSGAGIPGTANDALPDATLHYVPFTYAGMVNAYKLTSAMETTEEYAEQNKYDHSLFVAEYNVTRAVSWIDLNTAGLIFGKDYTSDGVDYTLRAPSVGSASTGSYDLERGTPQSNEWDKILDKGNGYIKNWEGMASWGQDIMEDLDVSAHRGHMSARYWNCSTDTFSQLYHGFRPVLEVLGLDTLGADGLKAVTLDLGDGKLGVESSIQIIVIDDSTFTAPASDGLTRPDGNTGSYFMWLGSDGKLYNPGDNVPADVTKLTAQFASSSHSVTITTATLPDGKVGEAYSQTLIATGTTPITWSIIGALPDGLSLNKDTGKISGTPTAAGSSTFTVKATNSAGSDTKELSITITKDAPPAHEHSYGDWRKDGTSHWHECTDDDCPNREESINDKAVHVYDDDADTTCDVCGYERTVTPPSHEHSYGDWSRDGTNHWHECTDDDCPNREESINDKAAHVYTDDADTTCDVCGYERTVTPPSHEHSYGDWRKDGTSHWHECTDDDCPDREESIKDKAAHVYTDDADTTCDTCGYERTITPPAHEHRYGDWRKDGTNHWHECTDADCPNREESIKDKAAHVYTDDADTTCDTCGYERTITPPAHEHRYGDWSKDGTSHWHECTDADCPNREESIKDKAAHVYDDDADTTCNVCGYERTVAPPAPTEFIVTFDGSGGTPSVGSMTTTKQKLSSLPSASRSKHSFDGWYTKKNGGTKITKDTVFHADTTVYAHWTYTGGGGSSYSYYTIKAAAGTGGSISPSGNVSVREGADQTFTITPDKGYAVSNVKIDGRSIGLVKSYTFENVKRAHTIEVSFTRANEFIDVPAGSYYDDAVLWAVENGITTGASASRFDPNGICTRAQAVTFLWRAAGSPKPETRTMPFTDVPVGSYYYDAVLWAVENGITKGTSDTTFSPNDTCTRAQIVSFLWRSEKTPVASSRNPFTDVKPGAYYLDAVLWVVESGITKGTTAMKFSPDADCTRAQIVTFLWRCKK